MGPIIDVAEEFSKRTFTPFQIANKNMYNFFKNIVNMCHTERI